MVGDIVIKHNGVEIYQGHVWEMLNQALTMGALKLIDVDDLQIFFDGQEIPKPEK